MVYLGTGHEFAGFESTVDYIGNNAIQLRTNNTGTVTVSVYTIENGALVKGFAQGETYFMQDYTAQRTMNEVLLKEPLTVGTAWTLADGAQRSITSVDTAVTVPYGAFTALEVTTEYPDSTVKDYYAPGFGLVKSEFVSREDQSFVVLSELSAYTAGEPAVQNIRIYYPDFGNEQIVFVDKAFEFYTGDIIIPKLESAFRSPPGVLQPLMSAGAAINSITFDPFSGVVTVDVSAAFITEMNTGARLEGMVLESVANTIGGYYLTDKVQITVDGGTYESGHMIFNAGEYLPYSPDTAVLYTGS